MREPLSLLSFRLAFSNKVPILKAESVERREYFLVANFNALVFDFVTRQKIQGQTLNLFNNLAVGGTLLLRSREIDGMKFAQSVKVWRRHSRRRPIGRLQEARS